MQITRETIEDIKLNQVLITGFIDMTSTAFKRSVSAIQSSSENLKPIRDLIYQVYDDSDDNIQGLVDDIYNELDDLENGLNVLNDTYNLVISELTKYRSNIMEDYDIIIKTSYDFDQLNDEELKTLQISLDRMSTRVRDLISKLTVFEFGEVSKDTSEFITIIVEDSLIDLSKLVDEESVEIIKRASVSLETILVNLNQLIESENVISEVLETLKVLGY